MVAGASSGRVPLPLWMSDVLLCRARGLDPDAPVGEPSGRCSGGDCTGVPRAGTTQVRIVRHAGASGRRAGCATDVAAWFARAHEPGRATGRSTCSWPSRARPPCSVVLPALDEEPTVGRIVAIVHHALGAGAPRTGGSSTSSSSSTPARPTAPPRSRAAAGARWCSATTCCPSSPSLGGKGEAMWRVAGRDHRRRRGVRRRRPAVVHARRTSPACSGPLLTDDDVHLVKAVYERPLVEGSTVVPGRRRPGHRARRPPAAQPALAAAGRRSCSRWPASTPPAARCSSSCRSRAATASRSPCSSTPSSCSGSTPSRRSTSACACTATTTNVGSAGWSAEILHTASDRLRPARRPARRARARRTTLTAVRPRGRPGSAVTEHEVARLERPPMASLPEYARRPGPEPTVRAAYRARQVVNALNLSTLLGLALATGERRRLSAAPTGWCSPRGVRVGSARAPSAFTVGNVVLLAHRGPDARACCAHEAQARHAVGVLRAAVPAAVLARGGLVVPRTGDHFSRNVFERRAGLLDGGYVERTRRCARDACAAATAGGVSRLRAPVSAPATAGSRRRAPARCGSSACRHRSGVWRRPA